MWSKGVSSFLFIWSRHRYSKLSVWDAIIYSLPFICKETRYSFLCDCNIYFLVAASNGADECNTCFLSMWNRERYSFVFVWSRRAYSLLSIPRGYGSSLFFVWGEKSIPCMVGVTYIMRLFFTTHEDEGSPCVS